MQMTIATLHCHLELAAINCFIAGMAGNISCVLHNYKNIKLKRLPELMGKTYDRGLKLFKKLFVVAVARIQRAE